MQRVVTGVRTMTLRRHQMMAGETANGMQSRRPGLLTTLLCGTVSIVFSFGAAQAQNVQRTRIPEPGTMPSTATSQFGAGRGEDVVQRFEQSETPIGMMLGQFRLQPRVQADETYDDNVFASKTNKRRDFITDVAGGARLDSNFARHYLGFEGNLDVNKFAHNSSEDFWHGDLAGHGRLDVTREIAVGADLSAQRLTEARGSPEDITAAREPTVFHVYRGAGNAAFQGAKIVSKVEGGVERLQYQDATSVTGATISTSDRDRDERFADGQIGYRYLGPEQIYLHGRVNDRSYDQSIDNSGFRRSSDGYRTDVGMTMDLGGLIFADVSVGYQEQSYDDTRFGNPKGAVGAARLLWNPTRRTTVRGEVNYEFQESFATASPGYWRTAYIASVAQEITYNLLGTVRFSVQDRDFINLVREDKVYGGDVGLRYRIDRGLFLDGEYRYRNQDSTLDTADFSKNQAMVRIRRIF
jgi:hypothetical protein